MDKLAAQILLQTFLDARQKAIATAASDAETDIPEQTEPYDDSEGDPQ